MKLKIQIEIRTVIMATLLLGCSAWAAESVVAQRVPIEVAALGPQIGEQIPNFALSDQNGQIHTRDSILGPNGAMVLFHRSADW